MLKTAALIFLALAAQAAFATDAIYTGRFSNTALDGYDAVAYFTQGKPVEGSADFRFDYQGATFEFSTRENLELFRAQPEKYAPQYGGYCAWAVSEGYTAKGDPAHWRIVDGRLYLNYNASVQNTWEQDIPGHIERADANWPAILN